MEKMAEKAMEINPVGVPDKYTDPANTPLDQRNPGFFLWCDETRTQWQLKFVGDQEKPENAYVYMGRVAADSVSIDEGDDWDGDDAEEDRFHFYSARGKQFIIYCGAVSSFQDDLTVTVTGDVVQFYFNCDQWFAKNIYIGAESKNPPATNFMFLIDKDEKKVK